jgi:hypothetical protein
VRTPEFASHGEPYSKIHQWVGETVLLELSDVQALVPHQMCPAFSPTKNGMSYGQPLAGMLASHLTFS